MPGFILALALRFPRFMSFFSRWWKLLLGVVLVVGAIWAFASWRDNLIDTADAAGFERARSAYQEAVEASNKREQLTQARLDQMSVAFGALSVNREQEINLTVKPLIERIKYEVSSDSRYRNCAVSDGVFNDLNTGRAAIDASVGASNPRRD